VGYFKVNILKLKCTKFNHWGSLQHSPRPSSGLRGHFQGEGRVGDEKERERERVRRKRGKVGIEGPAAEKYLSKTKSKTRFFHPSKSKKYLLK